MMTLSRLSIMTVSTTTIHCFFTKVIRKRRKRSLAGRYCTIGLESKLIVVVCLYPVGHGNDDDQYNSSAIIIIYYHSIDLKNTHQMSDRQQN